MPTEAPASPVIPLSRWASRLLRALADETGAARIAGLDGPTLLGMRGAANNYRINGPVSAGIGGSRMMPTLDGGWFALTLLRPEDRELLPALFLGDALNINDPEAIAAAVARHDCAELVARGRELGLPVASAEEAPVSPPVEVIARGPDRQRQPGHRPLVIDLSAIWAGPLAGHLLWLASAEVVKVESQTRPDLIRRDDPATFDAINQGKSNIAVDFASQAQKAALIDLIRRADVVIESSRIRALKHLGIDADALVREVPGLIWLSITGHGVRGDAANWAGIGNDCGVAAGLTRAMETASGAIGYVGDALPDPLTGITAALEAWRALQRGAGCRIAFSLTGIAARALAEERAFNAEALEEELRQWGNSTGALFPVLPQRPLLAPVSPFGADTGQLLPC